MFALDAKRMGYYVITLDPQEHSPAGQVADEQIVAAYDDMAAIEDLGKRTDVVTYEFENIAIASVRYLETHGYKVTPSSSVLKITQDRLEEKRFVRACKIATADFAEVANAEDLAKAADTIGFPAILKTVRGGYDGKGQWRVENGQQAIAALAEAKGALLIWEQLIEFEREVSVIATRNVHNYVMTFPVAENMHDRGILATTIAPARIRTDVAKDAQEKAKIIGEQLGIVGTYCVEFFVTSHGDVLVNEIAPRPHNSGHYTMDTMPCSQYEQHVRAICDLPLSEPKMYAHAIMMNILGAGTGDNLAGLDVLLEDPTVVMHLYGKKHAVDRRKMGHFTMLFDGAIDEAAIAKARKAHSLLRWVN
jgi:5-(carboxyamino)imidazole ribonucleotide synthase